MERTMPSKPRTRALKRERVNPVTIAPSEKKAPVDLMSLFRNPTSVIEVMDPRFEEDVDTGIRIEVSSRYSEEGIKVIEEYREKVRLAKDAGTDEPPVDDAVLEQLVVVTKRWWHEGETTDGIYLTPGELLACTPENKRTVFADYGWRWLRNLVLIRCAREANFFGKRPKTD
jgi:hypothetical protein